jgi:hypothetical protein
MEKEVLGLWNLVAADGKLYTTEPNHGEIDEICLDGSVHRLVDISATHGHIAPTALVFQENLYFGNLHLFPINVEAAKVFEIRGERRIRVAVPLLASIRSGHLGPTALQVCILLTSIRVSHIGPYDSNIVIMKGHMATWEGCCRHVTSSAIRSGGRAGLCFRRYCLLMNIGGQLYMTRCIRSMTGQAL